MKNIFRTVKITLLIIILVEEIKSVNTKQNYAAINDKGVSAHKITF